jgi:hypothetical protein
VNTSYPPVYTQLRRMDFSTSSGLFDDGDRLGIWTLNRAHHVTREWLHSAKAKEVPFIVPFSCVVHLMRSKYKRLEVSTKANVAQDGSTYWIIIQTHVIVNPPFSYNTSNPLQAAVRSEITGILDASVFAQPKWANCRQGCGHARSSPVSHHRPSSP